MIQMSSKNSFRQVLVFQLFLWTALFLIGEAQIYAEYKHPMFSRITPYDFCHLIFQIFGANFIYYILIKKMFYKKQYFLFAFSFVLSLYVISVLNRIFTIYIAEPFFINVPQDDLLSILTDLNYLFCYYMIPIISASFIFVSVMFMLDLRNEKQFSTELLRQKAELELKALKTQLKPHFLFNTLNNIYSLSIIDPEKTSESISRLSNILDYILYKGQIKLIKIDDEMKVINDYIELEKIRYDERLQLKIEEKIGSQNLVPPLLFLSLVENAFKHGAGNILGEIYIAISVETDLEKSTFRIENSFIPKENIEDSGLGLKIIQEQLEIIYGDRASCIIQNENNLFSVEIIVPANEN